YKVEFVLTFTKTDGDLSVSCSNQKIPCDENNLVYKVAELLKKAYEIKEGVHIHIEKKIPLEAGLAGGSTNAAATFRALKELWSIPIKMEEMVNYAKSIGADIPYCLRGGTALAEGIGEILTPLV
ncbi:MAG TPA: 4-(cytidine 5'-diphospho)-2-C-methyl-D-erythritol kinase, partial [Eubacteriaceae bacterium]|nr:4-(cytidine 5'-diphospho)-2-C-methyl-D-erythritol kinase [Eubacteriaceae bacterium]